MKILYIDFKYDYGNPLRGLSFGYQNFYDTLVKMNGGENEVFYFALDEAKSKFGTEVMNRKLLDVVDKFKPDLCFFFLINNDIKNDTLDKIKKLKIITLNWFADDHWRFYNFSRHIASHFTWVATTDPMALEKYNKAGIKNVIGTQWACNHFLCKPLELPKNYDATFLGQPHGNRKEMIDAVKKAGINIKCWGYGWPAGVISGDEMIKIFSQTKINIGLTNSSTENFLKSLARIFQKTGSKFSIARIKEWGDNLKAVLGKKNSQLKGRNYDIPGCGAFLLTQDADDLRSRYEDGREVVIFNNKKDLVEKIKYYLEHEKDREKIAVAGYERTIKDHTYEKRFNQIFKEIFK